MRHVVSPWWKRCLPISATGGLPPPGQGGEGRMSVSDGLHRVAAGVPALAWAPACILQAWSWGPEAKSWQYGPYPARSDVSLSLPGPQTHLSVSGPGSVTSNNGCCSWPVARLPWAAPGASADRHLHGSVCLWFQVAVHAGL